MLQILCNVIEFVEVEFDSAASRTRENTRKGLMLGGAMLLLAICLLTGLWLSIRIWTQVFPYGICNADSLLNTLLGFLGLGAFFLTAMIIMIVELVVSVLVVYNLYHLLVKRSFDKVFCQMFDVKPQIVRKYRWSTEHFNLHLGNFRINPYLPAGLQETEEEAMRQIVAAVRQKLMRLALRVNGLPLDTSDFDVQLAKEAFRTAVAIARLFSYNQRSRFFPTDIKAYVAHKDDQVWLNAQSEGMR
jgi:hypothetical protein